MGLGKKLIIAVAVMIAAVPALAAGTPHTVYGVVSGSQASTSCNYTYYVVTRPSETLSGTLSESGGTYFWQDNAGNFTTSWSVGDDSMVIVDKENNSGTATHAGFYAVMNEDLEVAMPQPYNDCALRQIPTPTATQGSGAVDLIWTAAVTDTSATPHGNNIVGYNVYRSTSQSTGFTKINSSTVTTTSYSDTTGTPSTTYYYTIEPIFRAAVALGVYSANSNAVTFPAPTPAVTGITPGTGKQDETLAVSITGTNAAWVGDMSSNVHFTPGTGITINTATGAATSIDLNITIASDAPTTARTVTVDGATGSATFTVQASQTLEGDVVLNLTYSSTSGNIHWISLPYVNSFDTASDVIAKINADHSLAADSGDKITQIGRWDGATQAYVTYDYLGFLGWSGTDFTIVTGEAIFLNIASDVNATLPGMHDPAFGINLVYNTSIGNIFWFSLPKTSGSTNAVDIIADINTNEGEASDSGNVVTQIGRWNGSTQAYETYDYLGFLGWSGTNFSFVSGEGYFVNIAGDVTDWQPETN